MQPDLQQAIRDRRFPTYLTPIKDVTDDVLRDILPTPSDIQYLSDIFAQASNASWVQQLRRLKMPRPSKRASLKTIHPDAMVDPDGHGRRSTRSLTPKTSTPLSASYHALPSQETGYQVGHNSRQESERSRVDSLLSDPSHIDDCEDIEHCPSHCGVEFNLMAKTKRHVIPEEGVFCRPCTFGWCANTLSCF